MGICASCEAPDGAAPNAKLLNNILKLFLQIMQNLGCLRCLRRTDKTLQCRKAPQTKNQHQQRQTKENPKESRTEEPNPNPDPETQVHLPGLVPCLSVFNRAFASRP